jgi:hypothetical protein
MGWNDIHIHPHSVTHRRTDKLHDGPFWRMEMLNRMFQFREYSWKNFWFGIFFLPFASHWTVLNQGSGFSINYKCPLSKQQAMMEKRARGGRLMVSFTFRLLWSRRWSCWCPLRKLTACLKRVGKIKISDSVWNLLYLLYRVFRRHSMIITGLRRKCRGLLQHQMRNSAIFNLTTYFQEQKFRST